MSASESQTRLVLALARWARDGADYLHRDEFHEALKAFESENAKENAKSPAPAIIAVPNNLQDCQREIVRLILANGALQDEKRVLMYREAPDLKEARDQIERLTAEAARLVQEWRTWAGKRTTQAMNYPDPQGAQMLHEASLHVIRADELEKALGLAKPG